MSSVLVLNHEPLEVRMSGPSIRSWELARTLAGPHRVTLAAPGRPARTSSDFEVRGYDPASLPALIAKADVVVGLAYLVGSLPLLGQARHLVVDLYDPTLLETLHLHREKQPDHRRRLIKQDVEVLTRALQMGDMFICASDRQRDFWTGWMAAAGRVNTLVHGQDPDFSELLRVVPFGISENPPRPGPPVLRGVVPGIGSQDFIVLWGGGIWDWFDPLTLIRAAARVRERLPQLRVVFPAVGSPSPLVPPMAMATRARELARDLRLEGSTVFFGTGWVPYEQRGSLLLEVDVGASLHRADIETRFSFRTRVLDYLWAGLPIVTTEGDSMAEIIGHAGAGTVVPYQDEEALAAALIALAGDEGRRRACAQRSYELARRFHWSEVAKPLLAYCDQPAAAPDRARPGPAETEAAGPVLARPNLLRRVARLYAEGGSTEVMTRVARRFRGLAPR